MTGPTLYYVRHGLTDWNIEGRLQGQRDVALNERGRVQAAACGEILRDLCASDGREPQSFEYASSPLVRARATMDIIRATLGLPPDGYGVDDRLGEISFGEWEGLTYLDVLRRDKDVLARRESNKWRFLPPGGESYQQLAVRVGAWYQSIAQDTVVTAHGGTARALIGLLGVALPEQAAHYPVDQGVVYVFADNRLIRYA